MFKKILFFILVLLFVFFLQISSKISAIIAINNVMPDFILLILILIYLYGNDMETMIYAFLLGYILDIFTGNLFGLNAFIYSFVLFLYTKFKNLLYIRSIGFYMFLLFIGLMVKLFFYYFFGFIFKEIFIIYSKTILNYLIHILYSLLFAPFLYLFISSKLIQKLIVKQV